MWARGLAFNCLQFPTNTTPQPPRQASQPHPCSPLASMKRTLSRCWPGGPSGEGAGGSVSVRELSLTSLPHTVQACQPPPTPHPFPQPPLTTSAPRHACPPPYHIITIRMYRPTPLHPVTEKHYWPRKNRAGRVPQSVTPVVFPLPCHRGKRKRKPSCDTVAMCVFGGQGMSVPYHFMNMDEGKTRGEMHFRG